MTDAEIAQASRGHSLIRSTDVVPGGIRIETAFTYPDGSSIEAFIVHQDDAKRTVKLSDLGQTTAWLLTMQVKPWESKNRQFLVREAIRPYNVQQSDACFECEVAQENFMDGIIRLSQACLRVSDLMFTKRGALRVEFVDTVEEFISDTELEYEQDAPIMVTRGYVVKVNFLVKGRTLKSGVLTVGPSTAQANEVFKKCYDLKHYSTLDQRVAVFDDSRVQSYRQEDLDRIADCAIPFPFSDRTGLLDLLAA